MKRRLLTAAVVVALLALAAWAYWLQQGTLSISQIAEEEDRLRSWIDRRPATAVAIAFALYVVTSLAPGTGGKAIICGWLFGFWRSLAIVDVALTIAAVLTFLFSRYLFLDYVKSHFAKFAQRLEQAWQRDGAFYWLFLRLAGAPYSMMNYAAGATGVPAKTFWWTTQVGILPRAAIWVFLGAQLPTLHVVAEEGFSSLIDPKLIVALTLPAVVLAIVHYAPRRPFFRRKETSSPV
ncbi:MAG: VTT domain-containing protein [Planctomycetes bacterium]|nr:VTT domain-containing protein [Planctomycetota bacterium]